MQLLADEREAMAAASDAAGAFLTRSGKTDLRLFSRDEWALFIRTTIESYSDKLRELRTHDDVPF